MRLAHETLLRRSAAATMQRGSSTWFLCAAPEETSCLDETVRLETHLGHTGYCGTDVSCQTPVKRSGMRADDGPVTQTNANAQVWRDCAV
eukprot:scaffold3071_cov253-Pinguiococcus_pyrenoidosus.AAC.4